MYRISLLLCVLAVMLGGCRAEVPEAPGYRFVRAWGVRGDAPGQFREPVGIVVDGDEVFVSDAGNDRIQVFDRQGRFLRAFGAEGAGGLGRPMHPGFRGDTLYVPEYLHDRIQRFTRGGTPLGALGMPGDGPGQFDAPSGVDVDTRGRLYVADFYHHRVQVLAKDGAFLRAYGQEGTAPGQFTYPTDVALFAGGGFVVADAYNHRVQAFDAAGALRWVVPPDVHGADSTQGRFNVATAVTVGPANAVYVADFYNHRVQVLSSDGRLRAVFGTHGAGPGQFDRPVDLALDAGGNLYVVDFGNDRIQVWAPVGGAATP